MSYLVEDDINGFVVQYGNRKDLQGKIRMLLEDDGLRKRIGERARTDFLGNGCW